MLRIRPFFESRMPFLTDRARHALNDGRFLSVFRVILFVAVSASDEKRS
jgi:hypothetical protein